jgi:hypothetical protein
MKQDRTVLRSKIALRPPELKSSSIVAILTQIRTTDASTAINAETAEFAEKLRNGDLYDRSQSFSADDGRSTQRPRSSRWQVSDVSTAVEARHRSCGFGDVASVALSRAAGAIWRGLVRPEGLEPPAYWFEASRSIQLSYGRSTDKCSAAGARRTTSRSQLRALQLITVLKSVFPRVTKHRRGPVAQLAEQQTLNLRVDGSIPSRLTTKSSAKTRRSLSGRRRLGRFDPTVAPNQLAAHKRVHLFRGVRTERGHHMRIRIHRDADLAVTQRLHHHSWMHTLFEQERRAGVPQVMDADSGKFAAFRIALNSRRTFRSSRAARLPR